MGTLDIGDLGSRRGLPSRHERQLIEKRIPIIMRLELISIPGSVQEKLHIKITFLFYLHTQCIIESLDLVQVFGRKVVR